MSVRAFRSRRWAAYILSLIVLGSAVWTPTSVYSQAFPGGGGQGAPSSPGVSWPVSDEVFEVCDDGDTTKCVEDELSGVTTANTGVRTWSGTTAAFGLSLTGPITVQSGTASTTTPGLKLGPGGYGLSVFTAGGLLFGNATTFPMWVDTANARFAIPSNFSYCQTNGTGDATSTADTCFGRYSAGVSVLRDDTAGSIRSLAGGGAAVASAAALPLPTGRVFHVTGTTTVTSITSTNFESGAVITLIFDGVLTFTDGSNLVLAGNFVTTASDTITLVYDGTSWHETSRSVN